MVNYYKILNLVLNKNKGNWMDNPFIISDRVYATDGMILISFDINKVTNNLSVFDIYKEEKLRGIYPFDVNINKTYTIDLLKNNLSKVPLSVKCEECDETTEVTYTYKDRNGNLHEIRDFCPVCLGTGKNDNIIKKQNGRFTYNPHTYCILGNSTFSVNNIKHIVEVADILQIEEFKFVSQIKNNHLSLFQIKDVDIVMILASDLVEKENIVFEIN